MVEPSDIHATQNIKYFILFILKPQQLRYKYYTWACGKDIFIVYETNNKLILL